LSVIVTGVGAVTPLGVGAASLQQGAVAGKSGIAEGMGRCLDFNPREFLTAKEVRRTDRFVQMALVAGDEAVAQAGWADDPPVSPDRIGCVVGSGGGGMETVRDQMEIYRERGPEAVSPLAWPMFMPNAAAAHLAARYGLRGECYSVSAACATGGQAIGQGVRLIEGGFADAAVVGGTDALLVTEVLAGARSAGAVSAVGRCLPFDRRRDGYVPAEAAGVLILEREEVAERRGVKGAGRVLSFAATDDAFHITAPDPEANAAARAISLALERAKLWPSQLDYVNAHGTGTILNDRSETLALKRALGAAAYEVPVSSTKSMIGHTQGAAGAVEAIVTLHALAERVAPPTMGLDEPEDGLDLEYVPNHSRAIAAQRDDVAVGISNSFGFGGHNTVLVLEA
jgi:3-oxoacyl-[acyl-carrier-protein] synthase II